MGTLVDLHTHTTISSGCSVMEPGQLIGAARKRGLDGVCVTDHYAIEGANVTQALGRKVGFPVFRGVEARTDFGDMLVFGYYQDIPEGISLHDLCWYVHEAGGLVFAAHPFHLVGGPSLALQFRQRGWVLSDDWERVPILRELDGIETVKGAAQEGYEIDRFIQAVTDWRHAYVAQSDIEAFFLLAHAHQIRTHALSRIRRAATNPAYCKHKQAAAI